jgi:ABC-type Fe3+ transport system permease subunit
MTSTIQLIILLVLGVLFGLSALSRRYPHIGWLQAFHIKRPQLSDEQKARRQRRANIHVAIQFILLGFGVPVVYVGSSVMMFNDPSTLGLIISGIIGFALIVLGITAIWSNRHRPRLPNRDLEFYKRVTGRSWHPPGTD